MKTLFFDYPDTARIGIKCENVLENPAYPLVYRVKTQKLDFLIPKAAAIIGPKYVYIPNSLYKQAYEKHIIQVTIR